MIVEKLELKHLAPYLPYGLKCIFLNETELRSIDFLTRRCSFTNGMSCPVNHEGSHYFQPILRPLSDLKGSGLKLSSYTMQQTSNLTVGLEWGIFSTSPYTDLVILFENHFDVFGLIESGLAVDINTLI